MIRRRKLIAVGCRLACLFAGTAVAWTSNLARQAVAADRPSPVAALPAGEAEGLFPYQFEHGRSAYCDLVTLSDGALHSGKAMEWADQVLVFGSDGKPAVFDSAGVAQIEYRRFFRHREQPELPDLTVAYVERLPRDPSLHGKVAIEDGVAVVGVDSANVAWKPKPGASVTFRVHVLNAGRKASAEATCRVLIDGKEIKQTKIGALEPRQRFEVEAPWAWQDGRHTLRVELQAAGTTAEINQWNNTFQEEVGAQPVAVVVARSRYDRFEAQRNAVDSYCFEDWVQYQLGCINALFRQSVYPTSPEGIIERVRCDRILIVEDPDQPDQRAAWQAALRQGGKADGLAEYAAALVYGKADPDDPLNFAGLKVDWPRLQQLGLQLGLVDLSMTDTMPEQCLAVDRNGRFVERHHLFPWPRTLMHSAGGFRLTEPEAAYLNGIAGRPRGLQGEYLYRLPQRINIVVRANNGQPLEGVTVDAYQLSGEGEYAGMILGVAPRDPIYSAPTDGLGKLGLLDQDAPEYTTVNGYKLRPNPFGRIAPDGSNALLMLKLTYGDAPEEYHFIRLFDCVLAALQGRSDVHVIDLRSRFAAPESPPATTSTAILMDPRDPPKTPAVAAWYAPAGFTPRQIEEFRVYQRVSLSGDEANPWRLVAVKRRDDPTGWLQYQGSYWQPPSDTAAAYSGDTFYAVSVVDLNGREGNLSAPGYLACGKDAARLAIHRDYAIMTMVGEGPSQLLRWDGQVATQPYGVRAYRFPGYRPAFAGIAISSDHRLLMTDPVNHVLTWYDESGELSEVLPHRETWPGFASDEPGEFYAPWDVAVDAAGRIYVADFGNHRVQILDSSGRFVAMLDADARFQRPHAVAFSNGHLCVTDRDGTRCRVYDVKGDTPVFVRELPLIIDGDRALVSKTDRVYITGRLAAKQDIGILVFSPDGDGARFEQIVTNVEMGKVHSPRGLYFFVNALGDDYGYCVNSFPFDVRRVKLD